MYTLRRISTVPATALHIMVDQPDPDGPDAGFTVGGSFYFQPAGQDGDTATVSEQAAAIIMGDAVLAKHFDCSPPWKPKGLAGADVAGEKPKKVTKGPGPDSGQ